MSVAVSFVPMRAGHLRQAARLLYRYLQPLTPQETAYFLTTRKGAHVALVGGRVAGLSIALDTGDILWWDFFGVDPSFRRLGILNVMHRELVPMAASEGFTALELSTDDSNLPVQGYWRKQGVGPAAEQPLPRRVRFRIPIEPLPGSRRTGRFGTRPAGAFELLRRIALTAWVRLNLMGVAAGEPLAG